MRNRTSSTEFKKNFFGKIPDPSIWKESPLQVHKLETLAEYAQLPTPFLQIDYHFILYLKKGGFVHGIGLEKVKAGPNSLMYVPAGTITSLDEVDEQPEGYIIIIEEQVMDAALTTDSSLVLLSTQPRLHLSEEEASWVDSLSNLLFKEANKDNPNPQIYLTLLQAFLHKLLELSNYTNPLNRKERVAFNFKQLVFQNFLKEKSTAFYADRLSVSENYMSKCVQSVYRKSPKEIILNSTILYSQLLMTDVGKSISEVCFELNLDDPSYFSRLFKKIVGLTPTEYRLKPKQEMS